MLGRLSQRESRGILLHLLPGCRHCQEVTSAFWDLGRDAREDWPGSERFRYDGTVERVYDRVRIARAGLETERAEARRLLAELKRAPAARWSALVQADRRFHTWGFCELLLDQNSELCTTDIALAVAGRIDAAVHPRVFIEELRSRAWTAVADARRRTGDLQAAEEALRRAESHLLRGTGDRLERAHLLERKAALRNAQERPGEAARLLSRAILLYRRAGQWNQVGRVLIGLGCIRAAAADVVSAERGRLWLFLDLIRGVASRLVPRPGR